MLLAEPQLATYLAGLKKQSGGRRAFVRRLLSLLHDYPREAFLTAVTQAEHYGLFELERLERMVLKQIASDYFVVPVHRSKPEDEDA